jgi:sugar phosphate isomerase/epimerase
MSAQDITFSVFTKPWKTPLPELGKLVADLGFDGVELPVRPGFQVEPQNVSHGLPEAARTLAEFGVEISSVAANPSEAIIAVCGELDIPLLRVMAPIGEDGYLASEARMRQEYEALLPRLQDANVKLGVQNHYGRYVCNAMGLRHLLDGFDPHYIGAVWDAAHTGLQGEEPDLALDIVWSQLAMVNLKNAFWRRVTGPEAEDVRWRPYWTSGRQGLASWSRVAAELRRRNYAGVVCLTAEYSDEPAVDRLIAEDIAYARSLFA